MCALIIYVFFPFYYYCIRCVLLYYFYLNCKWSTFYQMFRCLIIECIVITTTCVLYIILYIIWLLIEIEFRLNRTMLTMLDVYLWSIRFFFHNNTILHSKRLHEKKRFFHSAFCHITYNVYLQVILLFYFVPLLKWRRFCLTSKINLLKEEYRILGKKRQSCNKCVKITRTKLWLDPWLILFHTL